jgi:hypothetical protein
VKPMTWSMKGFAFRAPLGTPKMWRKSSFRTRRWGSLSKEASKERMGREPLRQLPVKWSSSIVCTVGRLDRYASCGIGEGMYNSGRAF